MSALAWIVALLGAALVNGVALILDLQEFLKRHPKIHELDALRDFKALVRRQMYQSLVQLLLLWGAAFVGLYAGLTAQLGLKPLLIVAAFIAGLYLTNKAVRGLRVQVRSLPTADKGLEGLFNAVNQIWTKRHLPDF